MNENYSGNRRQAGAVAVPQHVLIIGGALIAVCSLALAFAVMWITARGGLTITEEQAVQAAMNQVEADGVMTLEGRDTVAEIEDGNWHVYFPFSVVPLIIWGDVDCSGEVDGADPLPIFYGITDLDDFESREECPAVGSQIDPAAVCEDDVCSNQPRGGEPHVYVNGDDGSIEEVFYGQ